MEEIKVIDFIRKNKDVIDRLYKNGEVNQSLINDSKMYEYFCQLPYKKKMIRYTFTAEKFKVSETSVRRAISRMEKPCK